MLAWSCLALLLLSLVCETVSQRSSRGCNIIPEQRLNPYLLTGRWNGIKINLPPLLRNPHPSDASWQVDYEPETGRIIIRMSGRFIQYPYSCARNLVVLTPTGRPGHYHWRAQYRIPEADAIIAATDHRTYLVVHLCVPSFGAPCRRLAMVFGRPAYYRNQELLDHVDKIIAQKLCMDPREFVFNMYSPLGVEDCKEEERMQGRPRLHK